MSFDFDMAQALRRSHCDMRDRPEHECVGTVTIKRGEVCLSCPLCGTGEQIQDWDSAAAEQLKAVFRAAGLDWDALDMRAKCNAIRAFKKCER